MNITEILLNTIIGDTLGRPCNSMSAGHIKSSIKNIKTYIDSEIALRDKLEKWTKPGLYSSTSQFIILIGASFIRNKFNKKKFIEIIKNYPELENKNLRIFRNTEQVEDIFLINSKKTISSDSTPEIPTAKIIPFVIPSSLLNQNKEICIYNSIEIISLFTRDISTISGGIILSLVIHSLINNKNNSLQKIITIAIECCDYIIKIIDTKPENVFNLKINPDSLLTFVNIYHNIFQEIQNTKNAEEIICSIANKTLKNSVKRANLNLPILLIPYTFFLINKYSQNPTTILFNLLYHGGQTSTMLTIAGAIVGCIHGTSNTPIDLTNHLINKKKIISILKNILTKEFSNDLITEFIESENLLTIKEEQELKAKLKHYHKKKKKKKSKKEKNNELTKHVVESWTKIDKAKWKKQRKKL